MRKLLLGLWTLWLSTGTVPTAHGNASSTLTPADIQLAIEIGRDEVQARTFLGKYLLVIRTPQTPVNAAAPTCGMFSTPFSRVVIAACEARRAGRSLSPADVSSEMLRPELEVLAFRWNIAAKDQAVWCFRLNSVNIGVPGPSSAPRLLNVDDVTMLASPEKGAANIPAIRTEKVTTRTMGLPDHIWHGSGVLAVFSLTELPARPIVRLTVSPGGGPMAERGTWRVDSLGPNDGRPRFVVDLATLR